MGGGSWGVRERRSHFLFCRWNKADQVGLLISILHFYVLFLFVHVVLMPEQRQILFQGMKWRIKQSKSVKGPRTEPWGTPVVTGRGLDLKDFSLNDYRHDILQAVKIPHVHSLGPKSVFEDDTASPQRSSSFMVVLVVQQRISRSGIQAQKHIYIKKIFIFV